MSEKVVFVYGNKLNPSRDAFEEIAEGYDSAEREYVINGPSVTVEDINYDKIQQRLVHIVAKAHPNKVKIVLAGYSPLVAMLHDVANFMRLEQVYFMRDANTRKFVEIPLYAED